MGSKPIFVMARLVRAIHAFALAWQLDVEQDVGARNARGHHDSIKSDPGLGRALMFGLRRKRVDQLRAGCADVAAIRALHGESPCPGPSTTTGVPTFTRAYRSIESSLVMRIQPDETALPMYSG